MFSVIFGLTNVLQSKCQKRELFPWGLVMPCSCHTLWPRGQYQKPPLHKGILQMFRRRAVDLLIIAWCQSLVVTVIEGVLSLQEMWGRPHREQLTVYIFRLTGETLCHVLELPLIWWVVNLKVTICNQVFYFVQLPNLRKHTSGCLVTYLSSLKYTYFQSSNVSRCG